MSERTLFIVNTLMLAFNITMIVVQIVLGACIEDGDREFFDEEGFDDDKPD